ncbi:hypothetical protein TGAM01_v209001 [Trichoderma gamsii]|uniref:Homeobox and C2H2 transcription factor n=1 Tax=Trichoderma gamsii TaxID=398673 RepID=A0A2P4ZCV6_9HYPO|nr:hypothetical protein TGAM01_v209001 [Trichoderma gamsii]PON22127.1 hypothetical protein TGAM01_v209001 [Trichoderma gamsii]
MGIMGYDDLINFSSNIDNTSVLFPCGYCAQHHLHCEVAQEAAFLGACTSCIAEGRDCDFMTDTSVPEAQREPSVASQLSADDHTNTSKQPRSNSHNGSESGANIHDSLEEHLAKHAGNNSKAGARFSREALRILRNWLLSNHRHPYLSNEDKDNLACQTGLSKTQISNWVANARRRGKVRTPSSGSTSPYRHPNGINIPRSVTPALREMGPMERWQHSPPDQEPASITDIATAALSSEFMGGLGPSPNSNNDFDDQLAGSADQLSSASSSKTSNSSRGSFASAYSHVSRGSIESLTSLKSRGRRRRRRQIPKAVDVSTVIAPIHMYQCTFCTETFKTKHDWQRHEKSLHLSLERWICTPDGPIQFCAERNCLACVYCGAKNPSLDHTEQHNDFVCTEKSLEGKTFYRKDHLRQHLNIVHGAKFQKWPMNGWKVSTPKIRSRCGFCGILMDSWDSRVQHLAQHFKNGKSMAHWKGDWGFGEDVLPVVENGMPPYLIHHERNTPNPFEASKDEIGTTKTLEDYVKLWLVEYIRDLASAGISPTDNQLLIEAQRIVRKTDTEDTSLTGPDVSWFRDLIMLCEPSYPIAQSLVNQGSRNMANNLSWITQIEKIKASKSVSSGLSIIGCEKERLLMNYVKSKQALGQIPTDSELQVQACKAIEDVEPKSNFKSREAVQWFEFLINCSTNWLSEFKRRAGLSLPLVRGQLSEKELLANGGIITYDPIEIQETSVHDILLQQSAEEMLDQDMQRDPLIVSNGLDYLKAYKGRNNLETDALLPTQEAIEQAFAHQSSDSGTNATISPQALHWGYSDEAIDGTLPINTNDEISPATVQMPQHNSSPNQPPRYFLSDVNCYGRLERELTRFVASCLSPNNPLQHIPSDEEIQHQARWIIYDDDDPWNQTAADNVEWLARFKHDAGLTPSGEFGLSPVAPPRPWTVQDGGTGFHPPFVKPKAGKHIEFTEDTFVYVDNQPYAVSKDTAGRYMDALFEGEFRFPASVFCSRELEDGLNAYIEECIMGLSIPTDDDLRAKAREILGVDRTAADDPKLLQTFKSMHTLWRKQTNGESNYLPPDVHLDNGATEFMNGVDMLIPDI